MKDWEYDINEDELCNFIDSFSRFASRKDSRKHKEQMKNRIYTHEALERKTSRELAYILYRLRKNVVHKGLRNEFRDRLEIRSKEDLIQEILIIHRNQF